MAIPYANSGALGVDLSAVWTLGSGYKEYKQYPPFAVGTQITATDGSVWVYVKAGVGGVTGRGYSVVFDEDFLAVMLANGTGALGDRVGVPAAPSVSGDYQWVQVSGTCDVLQVSASCAANVPLATTTTAGQLDDAVGSPTKNVTGIVLTTAREATAGPAPAVLNFPVVGSTNA